MDKLSKDRTKQRNYQLVTTLSYIKPYLCGRFKETVPIITSFTKEKRYGKRQFGL